jgi:LPS-assembly lipoprotein
MQMLLQKLLSVSFLCLFLVGCGFQPLMTGQHKTPQQFTMKMGGSGYSTYKFRRELEKQLSLTPKVNDRPYVLKVSVNEGYVPLAYGTDATVSRNQIQATATYTIEDGSQTLARGTVTAYSAYILNYTQEFSTRSAQAAASERTLISLAEELSREIMLKIRSAPEPPQKPEPITEAEKDDWW